MELIHALQTAGEMKAIGFSQTEGWVIYSPCAGAPSGVTPEFLKIRPGVKPVALTVNAKLAWDSLIQAVATGGPVTSEESNGR